MSLPSFRILPAGDQALVAEFGSQIDESINMQVHALAAALTVSPLPGIRELVPTFRSLMICYDPDEISYDFLSTQLKKLSQNLTGNTVSAPTADSINRSIPGKIHEIPCCYEAPFCPDMEDLCKHTGLSPREIIRIHSGIDYKIYMLGFLPGFVYLGGLDPRIHCPRLSSPRTSIPAGSVGIGGNQTGIYPLDSPGGWRLIGKTPIKLYDPARPEPILCQAGDSIRFQPITLREFKLLLL